MFFVVNNNFKNVPSHNKILNANFSIIKKNFQNYENSKKRWWNNIM